MSKKQLDDLQEAMYEIDEECCSCDSQMEEEYDYWDNTQCQDLQEAMEEVEKAREESVIKNSDLVKKLKKEIDELRHRLRLVNTLTKD